MCRFFSAVAELALLHVQARRSARTSRDKFAADWLFESGEVFRAFAIDPATGICPADTTPTYRLCNNRPDANHRYTDQIGVFLFMKGKSYVPEGDGNPAMPIVFCTPSGGRSPRPPPPAPPIAR